ncbi:MAG: hypothetical protein QXN87_02575 [Candidatus Bathyarchaeia archaeon]
MGCQRILSLKSLKGIEIYMNNEEAILKRFENVHVKVAQALEEIKDLLEVGFGYVCTKVGLIFF